MKKYFNRMMEFCRTTVVIISLLALIGTAFGWYYSIRSNIDNDSKQDETIKQLQREIHRDYVRKDVVEVELKEIREGIHDIKTEIAEMRTYIMEHRITTNERHRDNQ